MHESGAAAEAAQDCGTGRPGGTREPAEPHGGAGAPAGAGAKGESERALEALERELSVFIRRTRASSRDMARAVHPDLEPGAYALLVRIHEVGAGRATDLAAYFGIGKATMSRQLRPLEELGLVAREPDPADGRAYLLRLTEEGRHRFLRLRRERRERYLELMASWDVADIGELARLLHRLNDVKEQAHRTAPPPGQRPTEE